MCCSALAVHFGKMVMACGVEASGFARQHAEMDMAVGRRLANYKFVRLHIRPECERSRRVPEALREGRSRPFYRMSLFCFG